MWNFLVNLERFVLSFKNTVQKEYLVLWQTLYVALLLFTTCPLPSHPYTVQSFVSSGSCHHVNVLLQDHWELETPICGLATTGEWCYTLYHKNFVTLNFLFMSLSHALSPDSVTRTKFSTSVWCSLAVGRTHFDWQLYLFMFRKLACITVSKHIALWWWYPEI